MTIINFYNNIFKPHLEKIGKFTLLKWSFYFAEIITTSKVFGTIYDKLRFRVGDKTYCFAYGNVSRCNFGVQMSFIGLLVAVYTLTLSIFKVYINVPPIMKWNEIDLCSFKLGLWIITAPTLTSWFIRKFEKKYARPSHQEDRMNKIQRMDKMIGGDVRKVRKMCRYTILILVISFFFLILEKWENKKKEKIKNN
mmetsp:Transcript_35931/g.91835  ORF Transcript_35931/g.91835 Transcript_35931/m.91835 type:complete len:195 (+) Transcript_35931:36-620(+)